MEKKEKTNLAEGEEIALRSMFPKGKELSIKEIMKHTPYSSYERNNTYLKSLAQKQIIEEKKAGRTLLYSIIPDTLISKKAFHAYAFEQVQSFSERHPIITKALKELFKEGIDIILVFGSYAKGTERKDSDIDILAVSNKKDKVERLLTSIKRKYGLPLHAIIVPMVEFGKIKSENKELWDSLVMHGILFKGYEVFYQYAYTN